MDKKISYGVLSDRDIRKEIDSGNIILHDPDNDCLQNIQNCSVDVTLGPYYYRNTKRFPILNPWNKKHVTDYWGKAQEAENVNLEQLDELGLKEGEKYILLQSGESILGHTREFIGGCNHITTMIKARSSLGRNNITICRDAGWGDIGYFNRYTLEITNNGTVPIILPVGARVGQVIFFYTGTPDSIYKGKYQNGDCLQDVVNNWTPKMMLPKLYKDKEFSV